MSVSAAGNSNFISNEAIMEWMQTKTDGIYGHMRESMDTSNTRAGAEDALNTVKAKLVDAATRKLPIDDALALVNDTLKKYGDEFPEVKDALQSIADDLNPKQAAHLARSDDVTSKSTDAHGRIIKTTKKGIPPVKVDKEQTDSWSKQISDKVEALSKQDQLGLINIQEFNAQLNQAKQTASALMDSADKAASAIISHIS